MKLTQDQQRRAEVFVHQMMNREHDAMDIARELIYLRDKQADLVDVLRWLHDLQNGCPLPSYEKDWNAAMKRAITLLKELE